MQDIHTHIKLLVKDNATAEEIRAQIEPRLADGCKLNTSTTSCLTSTGVSGFKECWSVSRCTDKITTLMKNVALVKAPNE